MSNEAIRANKEQRAESKEDVHKTAQRRNGTNKKLFYDFIPACHSNQSGNKNHSVVLCTCMHDLCCDAVNCNIIIVYFAQLNELHDVFCEIFLIQFSFGNGVYLLLSYALYLPHSSIVVLFFCSLLFVLFFNTISEESFFLSSKRVFSVSSSHPLSSPSLCFLHSLSLSLLHFLSHFPPSSNPLASFPPLPQITSTMPSISSTARDKREYRFEP